MALEAAGPLMHMTATVSGTIMIIIMHIDSSRAVTLTDRLAAFQGIDISSR